MAVWEKPPAGGIERKNVPATLDSPMATSSASLSMGGPDGRRTLRPTDTVSRNTMMAMANAPGGQRAELIERGGHRCGQARRHLGDQGDAVLVE